MTLLTGSLSLLVLWAVGASLTTASGIRRRGPAGVPADVAAGVTVLALLGSLGVISGAGPSVTAMYGVLGVAGAVVLHRGMRARQDAAPGEGPARPVAGPARHDPITLLLLAGAGLIVAALLASAPTATLHWDGWAQWGLKAKALFVTGTLPPAMLGPRLGYDYAHLDYPLAVPLVGWWMYRHAGAVDERLLSVAGAAWFALLPLLVWSGLRPRVGARAAALGALAAATFAPLSAVALGGTADVVFAVALLGMVVEMGRVGEEGAAAAWRAGLFSALAMCAKNEGVALAVFLAAVALAACAWSGRARALLAPALLGAVPALPWMLFTRAHGLTAASLAGSSTPGTMLARLPSALTCFAVLSGPAFTAGWLLLAAGLVVEMARQRRLPLEWAVLAGYMAVVVLVYLRSPDDVVWLITTSFPRVAGAVIPAAFFLGARALIAPAPAGVRDAR